MCIAIITWIVLIIWIICFVDGKIINECRLVLHSLTVAVCQLYLALLPLRRAIQQFFECVRQMLLGFLPEKRFGKKECLFNDGFINSTVHFFEGLCLFWESSTHLLSVVSTLCVCVRHVLQGALFLLLSTVRCAQRWVLNFKEGKEEWEKSQERQRQTMLKEGEQVEEFLAEYCQDAITTVKRRRSQGKKTGH